MMDEKAIEELEAEESMFVQTAEAVTSDGSTIVLHGVTPSTLYFSDRPQRVVGQMATTDFVDLWTTATTASRRTHPNAVLSFLQPGDDAPEDAVVIIRHPRSHHGHLAYTVEVLEGVLPDKSGPATLFIDPFRQAAVAHLGVRRAPARAAADAAAGLELKSLAGTTVKENRRG